MSEVPEQDLFTSSWLLAETIAAANRLADIHPQTALEEAPQLSEQLGTVVLLKREDTGPIGAFKWRGAANRILELTPSEREHGVIAASAGNHAQGVGRIAKELGIPATIYMPTTTPNGKVEAVERYGATVIQFGDNYSEAYIKCMADVADMPEGTRPVFIHPFDDPAVIVGQGTVGLEIMNQRPDATHLFVPVGGGGLIAGIASYVKNVKPEAKVIGVEPEDSNAMQLALQNGEVVDLPYPPGVFADGVAVSRVGETTFRLAQRYVDDVITVNNGEIGAAFADFWAETRMTLEPAGALALAGLKQFCQSKELSDQVMVAICSGANPSLKKVSRSIELAERHNGSKAIFTVELPETPGALREFIEGVVDGHNITELHYQLSSHEQAQIFISFSVNGDDDKQSFERNMSEGGWWFNDLTDNDIAQDFPLSSRPVATDSAINEHQFIVDLPERSGALRSFLETVGDKWNISLFHYRSHGSEVGQILIGFEVEQPATLEASLQESGYRIKSFDPKTLHASYAKS